jgi:hypothetical protein
MPDTRTIHINNRFVLSRLYRGFWELGLYLCGVPDGNSRSLPEMCKWNAFAIDTLKLVCEHGQLIRENIFHIDGAN